MVLSVNRDNFHTKTTLRKSFTHCALSVPSIVNYQSND